MVLISLNQGGSGYHNATSMGTEWHIDQRIDPPTNLVPGTFLPLREIHPTPLLSPVNVLYAYTLNPTSIAKPAQFISVLSCFQHLLR